MKSAQRRSFLKSAISFALAIVMGTGLVATGLQAKGPQVRLRTILAGASLNGQVPTGKAEYQASNSHQSFSVEVEDVRLPDGTQLTVAVNGAPVGIIELSASFGDLSLDSRLRQTVPIINSGDVVVVVGPNGAILSGVM